MSETPIFNSAKIYQDFLYTTPSTNPGLLTTTFLNYITSLNQGLLTKNVNYKVVSYSDTKQLVLFSLSESEALTFTVPTNYTVFGTTYYGIPLAGVAITASIYQTGAIYPTVCNVTATGFPNIVEDAVMLNASQIAGSTSVDMFNSYGFNFNNLFDIQDTLSTYVNDSVSTLGLTKNIIVGLLI